METRAPAPAFDALVWFLCLAGTSACGEAPVADPAADSPPPQEAPDLAHLRALGYVDWDEAADTSQLGVVLYDTERAWPGYNVYTNDVNEAYLCDLEGRRLHTWRMHRATQLETFELLPDGGIVAVSSQQLLVRLDLDSNVVWWHRMPVHHDVRRNPDGSFLVPYSGPGRPYKGRRVRFDGIHRISADGDVLESWFSWDHLAELQALHEPTRLDVPPVEGEDIGLLEYYHLNSVERLPQSELGQRDARFREGNLLICLRNADLICILDAETKAVVWSWGVGELQLPHMPTLLENGHILIFDNGPWRKYSRVVELDPLRGESGEIVWSYEGTPRESFFSEWRGSSQRLPNGNTLICEAERGHVFEVDPAGEVVWDFWNPEVEGGKRKRIYRFLRLGEERVRPVLDALRARAE